MAESRKKTQVPTTAPKKHEEQLKADFISLSSHQLRTPLSAVKWFSEIMLTQRAGKLTKKQLDYLREIHRSNERAIALVNDLLQVSRVQEGKLHIDWTVADLADLTEEVLDAHRSQIKTNEISVNTKIINGPLPKMVFDKVKIRHVIENLMRNAVNYTPRGGEINVTVKSSEEEVLFSVADSGVGIPEDEQGNVFTKFFRASNATRILPDGTGLGLFIAKSFIEAHGGKIWFTSQEGKGTTFYFTLPVKKPDAK